MGETTMMTCSALWMNLQNLDMMSSIMAWNHETCDMMVPATNMYYSEFFAYYSGACCASGVSACNSMAMDFPSECLDPAMWMPDTILQAASPTSMEITCEMIGALTNAAADNHCMDMTTPMWFTEWDMSTCTAQGPIIKRGFRGPNGNNMIKIGKQLGQMGYYGCCGTIMATSTPMDACTANMGKKWQKKVEMYYAMGPPSTMATSTQLSSRTVSRLGSPEPEEDDFDLLELMTNRASEISKIISKK